MFFFLHNFAVVEQKKILFLPSLENRDDWIRRKKNNFESIWDVCIESLNSNSTAVYIFHKKREKNYGSTLSLVIP